MSQEDCGIWLCQARKELELCVDTVRDAQEQKTQTKNAYAPPITAGVPALSSMKLRLRAYGQMKIKL